MFLIHAFKRKKNVVIDYCIRNIQITPHPSLITSEMGNNLNLPLHCSMSTDSKL